MFAIASDERQARSIFCATAAPRCSESWTARPFPRRPRHVYAMVCVTGAEPSRRAVHHFRALTNPLDKTKQLTD